MHGVVDREAGADDAAGAADVEVDPFVGVFPLKEQQLGDYQVGYLIVDRCAEENDALLEQQGVDVESPFPRGLVSITIGIMAWGTNNPLSRGVSNMRTCSLIGCFFFGRRGFTIVGADLVCSGGARVGRRSFRGFGGRRVFHWLFGRLFHRPGRAGFHWSGCR